jgi:protein MpaA
MARCLMPCLAAAIWLAGCRAPAEPAIKGTEPRLVRPVLLHRTIAGNSVQNRPIETIIFGSGPDVVLIMAAIHGNEPAGAPLAEMLADHLNRNPGLLTGKTVVIMPLANPDGRTANTRANARGVDLNRNFAAANRQNIPENGLFALSEPESRTISQILTLYHPDRIVSIHQPLNCIDYDGPAGQLARHMAAHCDLPVRKLGARPGSLGAFAGETLNIPIITVELKPNDHALARNQLWDRYGAALVAAITYPRSASAQLGE